MKKRFLLLLLILFPCFVFASTNTKSREDIENYGVTKYKVTDKNKGYVLKTPFVDETEKIYDFSEILTEEEETKILERIKEFTSNTDFDLVILTKELPYSNDHDNEDYSADFYDFNSFDKNGILFFRNTYSSDPYFDLYSFGDAQLYFYDTRLNSILDDIYDNIHEGNYYDGIIQLIERLEEYYSEGKLEDYFVDNDGMLRENDKYYIDKNGKLKRKYDYKVPILPSAIISLIITLIVISNMVKKNKMIRLATNASVYTNNNSINLTVNKDDLVNSITNRVYMPPSDYSGGGSSGGHSSSMGHSGGGHSSGGGRHG